MDRAVAVGLTIGAFAAWVYSSARAARLRTVDGIRVTPPPRAPTEGPVLGTPAVLPGVTAGADEPCELPYGPHRFKRSSATGSLAAELARWDAGSEPYAVSLWGKDIRELTAGSGGDRSATKTTMLGTSELPFAPPGGQRNTGYVLARTRKNFSVAEAWDAVNPVVNILGGKGPISAAKAVAALARGSHSVAWVVALYSPEVCAYEVWQVDGNPGLDALKGRL